MFNVWGDIEAEILENRREVHRQRILSALLIISAESLIEQIESEQHE